MALKLRKLLGTGGGALLGSAFGPAGALVGASIGNSLFGGDRGETTVTQGPLETPEQRMARSRLLQFAMSNPSYGGPLGSYDLSPAESAGQGKLMSFLNASRPAIFDQGVNTLTDLLTKTTFDPNDPNGVYAGFKEQNALNTADAVADLKRQAGFARNLYSSDTIQNLGRIETQSNLNLQNKLAELHRQFVQDKLNAVPLALSAGQTSEAMDLNKINAASTYGALPRTLADQKAKDAYAESVRSQGATTDALKSVAGGPPEFGVGSFSLPGSPSPWNKVLDTLAMGGAYALGQNWGSGGFSWAGGGGGSGLPPSLSLFQPGQWRF